MGYAALNLIEGLSDNIQGICSKTI